MKGFRSTCTRRDIVISMAPSKKPSVICRAHVRSLGFNLRSSCVVGIISLFVLFIAASAPHRVHHFFEKLPFPVAETHSDGHDHHAGDERESSEPQQAGCVMQSVAQQSHISSVQLIEGPFLEVSSAQNADHRVVISASFNPSPFSQRAPPTI
jgi:hypothetical protein